MPALASGAATTTLKPASRIAPVHMQHGSSEVTMVSSQGGGKGVPLARSAKYQSTSWRSPCAVGSNTRPWRTTLLCIDCSTLPAPSSKTPPTPNVPCVLAAMASAAAMATAAWISIVLFKIVLALHVQVGIAETMRQQPARRHFHDIVFQIGQHHWQVLAAQLENHLAAGAARRDRLGRIARDSQHGEVAWLAALGDCAEKCRALGAIAQAICSVFHITATEHAAILAQQSRTDFEARVRRIRQFAAGVGFGNQFLFVHFVSSKSGVRPGGSDPIAIVRTYRTVNHRIGSQRHRADFIRSLDFLDG